VRAHQGILILMRFHKIDGPLCRTCGRALVREMTTRTLWQGWWSPFSLFFFSPFTLLMNLLAHRRLAALPQPHPMPGAAPLPEGRPVLSRPQAFVALIPLLYFVLAAIGALVS
jgi:hypothetical protein